VLGDHDLWRLPQADSRPVPRGSPRYFLVFRPVFAANSPGQRISPNLAGRAAGALALCAQVFAASDPGYARRCLAAGQRLYDLAAAPPRGRLITTQPYVYYPELEWRDDMELGASELFLATRQLGGAGLPHPDPNFYVPRAAHWADAYLASATNGGDSLNLYDVAALGHFELVRILRDPSVRRAEQGAGLPVGPGSLLSDLRDQLRLASELSAGDPFGLSDPAAPVDTVPHALGFAIEARLWDTLTHTATYERLAATELDWVFGANPWGSSFTVGAGQLYPHCLAHPIANLSGSLTGRGAILRGATTDGPTSLANLARAGAPDGFRPCPVSGHDPFAAITTAGSGYRDDVQSFSTSEPSNDYVALVLLGSAQEAATG
jgi:endoglucanase